ncbi:MAG TPA: ECF transporter S component [Anaerolineae bacterium]|nr:ECF transporter S component [Anaerolineae bacterium]HNU02893.1 ECF transporter S component [Anaerolineae bacterium]
MNSKSQAQPHAAHSPGRTPRLWLRALVWAALLIMATATGAAQAQGPQNPRAGIVIDFGDGVVQTACVDLGADGQATGEEVLTASGFDVLIEYSPMGGAVCKIGAVGCNFPGQPCWCQCMSSPCVYWSYNYLQNGQWIYSTLGASVRTVHADDVEGWAWGAGTMSQGAAPPLYTFDQICAPPATNTPVPPPLATWTPSPTNTPWPTATWTPSPTNTPPATATWTPSSTPTSLGGLISVTPTSTGTPTATPSPTPSATATPTDTPRPTPESAAVAAPFAEPPRQPPTAPDASPTAPTAAPLEAGDDAASAQAVAQVQPTAPPTPTATVQALAALAALPARGYVERAPSGYYQRSEPALPPRLDSMAGNRPYRPADRAELTTLRPDYWPLALMIAGLTLIFGLARAGRRGAIQPVAAWQRLMAARPRSEPPRGQGARRTGSARLLSLAIYGLTAGIGLLALLHPFINAARQPAAGAPGAVNTPLLMTALVTLCFLALIFEVQGQTVSAKIIALLGVLVAINSVLRFIEVSIPGPGGFTPVFFLIVLTGYVFGARLGFLMGALTLLVSALITGGIGPWLPGQMFTAGWIGLLAPLAWPLVRLMGGTRGSRRELLVLAVWAGLCGLLFGVVINLWFWPYMTGPVDQYWQAGVDLAETVRRYTVYYLATSLLWDAFAVGGNVLLMLAFGAATLAALRRFQQRFDFDYQPAAAARPAALAVDRSRPRPAPTAGVAGPGREAL